MKEELEPLMYQSFRKGREEILVDLVARQNKVLRDLELWNLQLRNMTWVDRLKCVFTGFPPCG